MSDREMDIVERIKVLADAGVHRQYLGQGCIVQLETILDMVEELELLQEA